MKNNKIFFVYNGPKCKARLAKKRAIKFVVLKNSKCDIETGRHIFYKLEDDLYYKTSHTEIKKIKKIKNRRK